MTQPPTVGVLSPGDLGRSIGTVLQAHGVRTLTSLAGRSERTRALAADAGFEDTASLADCVQRIDILLHRIDEGGVLDEYEASSKLKAEWDFFQELRDAGRQSTQTWLAENFDAVGVRDTLDLRSVLA